MFIVQLYYKKLFIRLHWIWFVTGTSHNCGALKLFPKYFGINHVIVWLDDKYFVQLCNSYELLIDTFVKLTMMTFKVVDMDYGVYGHFIL